MNAIETRYKGYRFRSRTEARWAVYFDACRILWEYEREGYKLSNGEWYLPDFYLTLSSGSKVNHLWAEVKGQPFTDKEILRCKLLVQLTGLECLLLDGPPDLKTYDETESGMDYVVGIDFHDYPHTEARFYACPGCKILAEDDWPEIAEAVNASRSARFEYQR